MSLGMIGHAGVLPNRYPHSPNTRTGKICMREPPKNKVSFDISGRYLRELKIVLRSRDVREKDDYLDSEFDEKRLLEKRHLLTFFTADKANQAERIWTEHLGMRLHA
jgi:hypothetical protein